MKVLSAVFLIACLGASVSAAQRLKVYVSQVTRAEVIVQAIVERAADNRAIEVVAESDAFYRSSTTDLDHLQPYDPLGPPHQTNTQNLAPLGRFGHRVKTHGRGWTVQRLDPRTLEWTTPHGFTFHVDPTGTHRAPQPNRDA